MSSLHRGYDPTPSRSACTRISCARVSDTGAPVPGVNVLLSTIHQPVCQVASLLHNLTRKDVEFKWTDDCQAAFETLKRKLTQAPIFWHIPGFCAGDRCLCEGENPTELGIL